MRQARLLLLVPMLSLAADGKGPGLRLDTGQPPPGLSEAAAELESLQKEIDELKRQLSPELLLIREITQAFQEDRDFEATRARMAEVLQRIKPSFKSFFEKIDRFDAVRARLDEIKLQHAISRMMSGGAIPANAPQQYLEAQTQLRYSQEVRDFRGAMFDALKEVDSAHKVAYERARTRRVLRRVAWGSGAAAALGAGLLLLWQRRRSPGPRAAPAQRVAPARQALPGPAGAGEFTPGSALAGSFRIDRELGRGGMGVVYEATDLALNRKVAIKRMHDALANAGEELERFLSEARLVASLKHPNIVEIYAISRDQGRLLLIFEFVAGASLSALLKTGSRLPMRSAKSVVKQAASALDHAHGAKVIHRDLKPSNVMVTSQGWVKVMDFGIAHHASVTMARLTRAQTWGTPAYMAPEHEMGAASRESDLFSLGACVYEFLSGRAAFTGPNFLAQKQRMLFTPLSRLVPGLPKELDAVMAKALHPDPKQRFHSGAEFSAAFERLPG